MRWFSSLLLNLFGGVSLLAWAKNFRTQSGPSQMTRLPEYLVEMFLGFSGLLL